MSSRALWTHAKKHRMATSAECLTQATILHGQGGLHPGGFHHRAVDDHLLRVPQSRVVVGEGVLLSPCRLAVKKED